MRFDRPEGPVPADLFQGPTKYVVDQIIEYGKYARIKTRVEYLEG